MTDDRRFSNDGLARAPYSTWAGTFAAELAATGPQFLQGFGRNDIELPDA